MSSQMLYNTQKIRGFQHERHEFSVGKLIWHIKRRKIQCSYCGNEEVQKEVMKRRRVRGLPSGTSEVFFEFDVHRLYCLKCRNQKLEELHFLSHAKSRMTRSLERTVLELRKHMSIQALCRYFHLRWHTVKELEKEALARKFRRIQTTHVKAIGIDEIHREREGKFGVSDDCEGPGIRSGHSCRRGQGSRRPGGSAEEVEEEQTAGCDHGHGERLFKLDRKEFPESSHRFRSLSRDQVDE